LLRITRPKTLASLELRGEFQIEQQLYVPSPMILWPGGLEQDLAEADGGWRNLGQCCQQRLVGGDMQFYRLREQMRIRRRWIVIGEERVVPIFHVPHCDTAGLWRGKGAALKLPGEGGGKNGKIRTMAEQKHTHLIAIADELQGQGAPRFQQMFQEQFRAAPTENLLWGYPHLMPQEVFIGRNRFKQNSGRV